MTIQDPSQYPVSFRTTSRKTTAFKTSTFPVQFAFNPVPRKASLKALAIREGDVIKTDINPYKDTSVLFFEDAVSKTITLHADNTNLSRANFYLQVESPSEFIKMDPFLVNHVRQGKPLQDIVHQFSLSNSVMEFGEVNGLYPAAGMNIKMFVHGLSTSEYNYVVDQSDRSVSITTAETGMIGIVDMHITIPISWYEDEARTIPALLSSSSSLSDPYSFVFGIRFYILEPGSSAQDVLLFSTGSATAQNMYTSEYLLAQGAPNASCYYFGGGQYSSDLFMGYVGSVEVSNRGMPVQGFVEVPAYLLTNPLVDYELSSSQSSSPSSSSSSSSSPSTHYMTTSSSSSKSTQLLTSSLSSSSSESSSSTSSLSSFSTQALTSSASSSSSSSSSESTRIKSSSSTALQTTSVSQSSDSSLSSSTFAEAAMQTYYDFNEHETATGVIEDKSGNGNTAKVGAAASGLGPPSWGADYGLLETGGYRFSASISTAQYIESRSFNNVSTLDNGTLSFWIKVRSGTGNTTSIPYCISNGMSSVKTELSVSVSTAASPLLFTAQLRLDGTTYWQFDFSSAAAVADGWVFVVITQNNGTIKPYLQGTLVVPLYKIQEDKTKWISDLFANTNTAKADRMILGGAPRIFSPFIQYGFTGEMDEVKVWNAALNSSYILSEYNRLRV